jgi:nicotinamide riboside transporter PnuC
MICLGQRRLKSCYFFGLIEMLLFGTIVVVYS